MHVQKKQRSPKLTRRNQRERLKVRYGLLLLKMQEKNRSSFHGHCYVCIYQIWFLLWGPQQQSCKDTCREQEEKQIFQVSRETIDLDSNYSLAQFSFIISY